MPKCPVCGFSAPHIYQCDRCGDIRCDSSVTTGDGRKGSCGSSKSPTGKKEPGAENHFCWACKKGKYHRI